MPKLTRNRKSGVRTQHQLARQKRAFDLKISLDRRWTHEQIAKELHVDADTITADLRYESERRRPKDEAERIQERMEHIAQIDEVIAQSFHDRGSQGTGAYGALTKALEMKAKVLGLEAPQRVEIDDRRRVVFQIAPRVVSIDVQDTVVEALASPIDEEPSE